MVLIEDSRLFVDDDVNTQMLTHTTNYGSESFRDLPVYSIIEHVEKDNDGISDSDITVTLKLDEKLLNPVECLFVVGNLGHKKSALN